MFVTKDKKHAINEDLVEAVSVTADDSVILSIGANAITFEGDDAKAAASEFGLTLNSDDENAAQKKRDEKREKDDEANAREKRHAETAGGIQVKK